MRAKIRPEQRLAALAAGQHGVVSRSQLRNLGYSEAGIGRAVAAGRLHRVHRSVYAVGHPSLSTHGRCLAAVLACGPKALLSHHSAGWLWGLISKPPSVVDVTVPWTGHSRTGLRAHHAPSIGLADRASSERVPVTSVARTLIDLASALSERSLDQVLERGERFGRIDLIAIDQALARSTGHRGARRLDRALDLYRDPAFLRSRFERVFLPLVLRAGLPRPATNVFVAGCEVDLYWEKERFAVELDGFETHGTRAAFERDPVRQEDLKLAGIDSIRLTWRRVMREPDVVAERLRTLLERRRNELHQ